jgi:hypothetical protein
LGKAIRLPLLLGSKRNTERLTADEIRGVWGSQPTPVRRARRNDHLRSGRYDHVAAESAFVASHPKEFRFGIRYTFPDGLSNCIELWVSGPSLLVYRFSEGGLSLCPRPIADLAPLTEMLRDEAAEYWNHTDVKAEEYTSLDDPGKQRKVACNAVCQA